MSQEYLIDASMLIKAYIQEENSARVHQLLFEAGQAYSNIILHVPEFCLLECTNILWKKITFENMTLAKVELSIQHLMELPLTFYIAKPFIQRALEIGVAHRMAIYDMVYLALAEKLKLPLITNDDRQGKIATQLGIPLKLITDFPEYQP
jgi:predicted nucleic acid-binding protein